jgi:Domain of unknown function (DUF4062)
MKEPEAPAQAFRGTRAAIRMPGKRLRVFVSSTPGELAAERKAAAEAIVQLRLTPVMFELGDRAHPPRALYRSYLEQSDVFVGIYWQQYGWVAPGEDVSGVEDEYLLCATKPRLLYVRDPAYKREPRLAGLLRRMQADGTSSYKQFAKPEDLRPLLAEDLARLLTERFPRRTRT